MKTTFRKTTIALAVAAVMAPPAALAFDQPDPPLTLPPPPEGVSFSDTASNNNINTQEFDNINYNNVADVHLIKKSKIRKWVDLSGEVDITGTIEVNSAALAIADDKQLILDNWVDNLAVENETNVGGTEAGQELTFEGNTQLNAATGDDNAQGNDLAIAVANNDFSQVFGSADAEAFVFQNGEGNLANNIGVQNEATVAGVTGNGNLHINATAGNFNMQKNALVLAVGSGRMAEANVYDKQELIANVTENEGLIVPGVPGGAVVTEIPDPFGQGPGTQEVTVIPGTETVIIPVTNVASLQGVTTTGNTGINVSAGTNLLQANKVAISAITP